MMETDRRSFEQRLRPWVLLALVAFWGAMFVGTHIPMPPTPDLPSGSDKYMHFGAYAGLAFLLGLYRAVTRPMTFRQYAAVFGVTVVYSVVDELLQMIPALHRTADFWDAVADWCGSIIGLCSLWIALAIYRRRFRT